MQVVCLSSIDWDFLWQRHQTFMTRFADSDYDVYFVENTGFRNPTWRDLGRLFSRLSKMIGFHGGHPTNHTQPAAHSGIKVISPSVLPPNGLLFRWLNHSYFIPRLTRKLQRHGVTEPDLLIYYLPTATSLHLIRGIGAKQTVYDCVANFQGHPNVSSDFRTTEKVLLDSTDLVVVDSDYLYDVMKDKHSNVHQIHQGVDIAHFRGSATGVDHRAKQYNSICFFGALDHRMDWEAVKALIAAGIEVHLIGPHQGSLPPGVIHHQPVPHHVLGKMVQGYDAFFIPYRKTSFTAGIVPAKLFECFATGKPVLVSDLPYSVSFNHLLYICRQPDDYVHVFKELNQRETSEKRMKRIELAERQSAEVNFRALLALIEGLSTKGKAHGMEQGQ